MQVCLLCKKPFEFLIPVGEIVICKSCIKELEVADAKIHNNTITYDSNSSNRNESGEFKFSKGCNKFKK